MAVSRLVTGLTPAREQREQEKLFVASAMRMEASIRREIARAMRELAEAHESPGAQAGALDEHRKRMEALLDRSWRSVFTAFGDRIIEGAAKGHRPAERKGLFDEYESLIANWIRRWSSQKVTQIVGTTRDQALDIIRPVIAEAVREGIGQAATGRVLQRAMREQGGALSRARARVISRSETHAASQGANQAAAKATGLPMKKIWLASAGERTREEHADADGQTRRLDEPFIVGGEELDYPGDPSGSAGMTINCRCAISYIVAD